jgi:hypothetical protein
VPVTGRLRRANRIAGSISSPAAAAEPFDRQRQPATTARHGDGARAGHVRPAHDGRPAEKGGVGPRPRQRNISGVAPVGATIGIRRPGPPPPAAARSCTRRRQSHSSMARPPRRRRRWQRGIDRVPPRPAAPLRPPRRPAASWRRPSPPPHRLRPFDPPLAPHSLRVHVHRPLPQLVRVGSEGGIIADGRTMTGSSGGAVGRASPFRASPVARRGKPNQGELLRSRAGIADQAPPDRGRILTSFPPFDAAPVRPYDAASTSAPAGHERARAWDTGRGEMARDDANQQAAAGHSQTSPFGANRAPSAGDDLACPRLRPRSGCRGELRRLRRLRPLPAAFPLAGAGAAAAAGRRRLVRRVERRPRLARPAPLPRSVAGARPAGRRPGPGRRRRRRARRSGRHRVGAIEGREAALVVLDHAYLGGQIAWWRGKRWRWRWSWRRTGGCR